MGCSGSFVLFGLSLVLFISVLEASLSFPPLCFLNVREDIKIGTQVTVPLVTNKDYCKVPIAYSIVKGSDFFEWDTIAKKIQLRKQLDYEKNAQMSIEIAARCSFPQTFGRMDCLLFIANVNDEIPKFGKDKYYEEVKENAPVGTTLFKDLTVTDAEGIGILRVFCDRSKTTTPKGKKNVCDIFEIVRSSTSNTVWRGSVRVRDSPSLDRETTNGVLNIPATATDGQLINTENLVVGIIDSQDTPPIIQPPGAVERFEVVPTNTELISIDAKDGDTTNPRKLCYDVIGGTGNDYIDFLDPRQPIVIAKQPLDRENRFILQNDGRLRIVFRVREIIKDPSTGATSCSNKPIDTATSTLLVRIKDINDNPPLFDKNIYEAKLSEGSDPGSFIPQLAIKVSDADQGDNAVYEVKVMTMSKEFLVEPGTGRSISSHTIKHLVKFDYDDPNQPKIFRFPLVARETLTSQKLSSTALVDITLIDVNDNKPEFGKREYTIDVPEDTPIGKSIAQITASDRDSAAFGTDGIRYSLIGTGLDKFKIDPRSGVITIADCSPDKPGEGRCLDYEKTKKYSLTVIAKDDNGRGNEGHTELVINVLDVNDNAPRCQQATYTSEMKETSNIPDPPIRITAIDADSSRNGNNRVSYTIISGNVNGVFRIDSNGVITASTRVDYDSKNAHIRYNLLIEVRDPTFKRTCTAVIDIRDVNDNAPTFGNQFYNTSISELTPPGTPVITVSATDGDRPTSVNGRVVYRIVSGAEGKFEISRTSGNITVAPNANFDYDLKKLYNIVVAADDLGNPSQSGIINVAVHILDKNNKSPYFAPAIIRVTIWENATVGTYLTTLSAIDQDTNPRLVYSFGKIAAFTSSRVAVNQAKYDFTKLFSLRNADVATNATLDYESAAEVRIDVIAVDANAKGQSGTGTLYIEILDINENDPVFVDTQNQTFPHYNITMMEENPVNTFVTTMLATDVDVNQISRYVMIDDANGTFAIAEKTGVVTVKKRVDYEKIQNIKFSVMAYDVGVPIRSASATVFVKVTNLNDNIPQFNQTEYLSTIFEHSPGDTYVTTVKASDLDLEDYGNVRYNMTDSRFYIDQMTGVVRVKKGAVLDREITPVITVKATAYDSPKDPKNRNLNFATIRVTLLDINDHPPVFSEKTYYAQITENTPATTSVIQLRAADGDGTCNCNNAAIRYSKINGTGDSKDFFKVDGPTGLITVNKSLIGESYSHVFKVLARDGAGSGNFSATATVTISVIDANNKPPEFILPPTKNFTVSVLENQYLGMLVYRVRAIDPDGDANSPITYGFRVDNKMVDRTKEFRINPITGEIRAEIVYDREAILKYHLHVSAADHGVPSFVTTIDIVVLILDVDDNLPQFPRFTNGSIIPYNLSVSESGKPDTLVGEIQAIDKDTKDRTQISYSIVSGNVDDSFRMESKGNKGYLRVNKPLDRERIPYFELLVRASNRATSYTLITKKRRRKRAIDASATVIRVYLLDVNDNTPQFELPDYRTCVPVSAPYSKSILDTKANDKDTGVAGRVFYKLRNVKNIRQIGETTDRGNAFTVSSGNGTIYTNELLNKDGKSYFDMTVVAYNNDSTNIEGTTSARVYVTESITRVKVSIKRPPDEVNRYIKDYRRVIAESLGSKVICVEDIKYHINNENIIEVDKADLIVHVVNMETNTIYPASTVVAKMKEKSTGDLMSDYKVLFIFDISPVEVEQVDFTIHPVFILMCIIGVILLLALLLLGLICFFLNRQYKREMRKAKYVSDGVPVPTNTTPGGTVNPLWKERMEGMPEAERF